MTAAARQRHEVKTITYSAMQFRDDAFVSPTLYPTVYPVLRRRGERFDRGRHVSGTEVKAITYSAMQIREAPGDAEVFVIVDI